MCEAVAVLKVEHVAAARRIPMTEPWYVGAVPPVVICTRPRHVGGWHECRLRPLADAYGGGTVGIRWRPTGVRITHFPGYEGGEPQP
ncbi:hypothetical protein [Streptomyces sp. NPDC059994]|uniref:hypothetical protein n=1 Tax=Streptomyces sp. NPDC059994 TaxID=3347029 RepID=UPI00367E6DE5